MCGHPVREDDIKVMTYRMVLEFVITDEWVYRILTAGRKVREVRRWESSI